MRLASLARLPIVHDGTDVTNTTGGGSGSSTSTSYIDNGATLALVNKGSTYKIIGSDDISYYLSQGYSLILQSDNVAKLNSLIPIGVVAQTGSPTTDAQNNYLPYIIGGAILLILIS